MTLEEFFTQPTIRPGTRHPMTPLTSVSRMEPEPFMGRLTVRINHRGGAVYDGDRVVATIRQLHSLIVDPAYRGQGIGAALIVAWARRNPHFMPKHRPVRTREGAASYRKAWRVLTGGPVRHFPGV